MDIYCGFDIDPIGICCGADYRREHEGGQRGGEPARCDAIATANGLSGTVIDFSVTGTITLLSPLPSLSAGVTIMGPGQDQLTIDADGTGRVLHIGTGAVATVSG